MKTLKTVVAIALSAVGLGSAVTLAATSNSRVSYLTAKATAPTNTRRIWIIDNNDLSNNDTKWWTGSTMYVHVWTSNPSVYSEFKVNDEVCNDYYKGLWYVDVTFENATTSLNVIVRIGNSEGPYSWGDNNQTFTQPLDEFGEADTIWLNGGVTHDDVEGRNSRSASIGTTNGFSGAQLAAVMSHYHTCSSTNTDGYNAYPQLKTNFLDKTDASVFSTKVYGQDTYTIQDYVDGMYARYSA